MNDVDVGETFSVAITETGTVRGALSTTTLTGNATQIAAAVQALVYTPFQQSANVTAAFDFAVTEGAMSLLGFLFALGFDTATEVALLGLSVAWALPTWTQVTTDWVDYEVGDAACSTWGARRKATAC